MADKSLTTIPLFGDAEFYLPLKVAQRFGFSLSHHIIDGRFWGSLQDWLVGLLGTSNAARLALDNFMRSDSYTQLSLSGRVLNQNLDYLSSDGKTYQTAHGSEYMLYVLTQNLRVTKKRPQIAAVKAYLAESGVIVGEIVRDPEGTALKLLKLPDTQTTRQDIKAIRKATDSGYSYDDGKTRLALRDGLKEANKRVHQERSNTGLVTVRGHWIKLNAQDFHVALGITQEQWRELNGKVSDINEHLSSSDLVSLTYLKETIADLIAENPPKTYTELYNMIERISVDVQRVRRVYERGMPTKALRDAAKPKQTQLKG